MDSSGASGSGFNNNDIEDEYIPDIEENIPDIAKYIPLHRAIMSNNWKEAKRIFDMDKDALTAKIDVDGHTPLHIAIRTHNNFFAKKLLEKIYRGPLQDLRCKSGWTTLHTAASVGNLEIVDMLVEKDLNLLFIDDNEGNLPINTAIINFHINTFKGLLDFSKHIGWYQGKVDNYCNPFDGEKGVQLLINVILCGELDIAYELIKLFPEIRRGMYGNTSLLNTIASKSDAYLSAERYNFCQRFLYSLIIIEKEDGIKNAKIYTKQFWEIFLRSRESLHSREAYHARDREQLCMPPLDGCSTDDVGHSAPNLSIDSNGCSTDVGHTAPNLSIKSSIKRSRTPQGIFWEVAARVVPHINKLYEDKKKHRAAANLLECICKEDGEEDGALTEESHIVLHYENGFNLAVENDTPEVIEAIIRYFPQATNTIYKDYRFSQNAIINRSKKVYNIAVEHAGYDNNLKTCIDEEGNNLLHLAGKLAPIHKLNEVSGAALQMQREFQWFKVVEKFVFPSVREQKNKAGETPITVFRKEHKDLRKDGEEWMKKTAESYTITAALIITIAFAAAITVPGGNNDDTGKAIFEKQASFIVFVVADAISFFTSSTSLLLFLSVLTARYREEDFLYGLPKRIILGLLMLFLSMTSMIIAFSATLYLLVGQEKAWILISLAALACMSIASFVTLQFPLLTELIYSTYGHGILSKERDSYRFKKLH